MVWSASILCSSDGQCINAFDFGHDASSESRLAKQSKIYQVEQNIRRSNRCGGCNDLVSSQFVTRCTAKTQFHRAWLRDASHVETITVLMVAICTTAYMKYAFVNASDVPDLRMS